MVEAIKLIGEYTSKDLYDLAKELQHRETVFMNPKGLIIRCIKADNKDYLYKNMMHYRLADRQYNIYKSIATYKDFPMFSWKKDIRHKQYDNWTKKLHKKHIVGYDYYIDFDNPGDDQLVKQECITVAKFLKSKQIKFQIYFSGSGYHIKCPVSKIHQNPDYCRLMTEKLKDMFMLETPDLSIYRWQGIIKVPGSIDYKTGRRTKELTLEELESFEPKSMLVVNVFKNK